MSTAIDVPDFLTATDEGLAFDLFDSQLAFLRLTDTNRFTAFVGGVGSGKTAIGAFKAIEMIERSPADGMVIAPTYRMMTDFAQAKIFEFLDALHWSYSYSAKHERLRTRGRTVYFRSADNPDRLRGPNLGWAWADEAAMMKMDLWRILLGRLRIGDARAWITTTPAGFNWVYNRFEEKARENYAIIHASTRENITLRSDFVGDLEDDYTDEFAAQEIEGQFVAFEGVIYKGFSKATHVIDPFVPPPEWPRMRGIDFGYTNPFVCGWWCIDPDGRLIMYNEHYENKMLLEDHATWIHSQTEMIDDLDDNGDPKKDEDGNVLQKPLRYRSIADHDAQDVAELRKLKINTHPAKKDVHIGIQKVMARLKVQPDGKPRLMITRNCVETIKEMSMYRWTNKESKEDPLKEHDHSMDQMRYVTMDVDNKKKVGVRWI